MKIKTTLRTKRIELSLFHTEEELINDYEYLDPNYYRPLEPTDWNDLDQYNGNHFIGGTIEYIFQSDIYIPAIWNGEEDILVSVTHEPS